METPNSFNLETADLTALMNEIDRLTAEMAKVIAEYQRLRDLCARYLERFRQRVDNFGKPAEQIMKEIEANVQRSATRIIRNMKKQGRTLEEARVAARSGASMIADKYGLRELTERMLKRIEDELNKAYGKVRKPLRRNH